MRAATMILFAKRRMAGPSVDIMGDIIIGRGVARRKAEGRVKRTSTKGKKQPMRTAVREVGHRARFGFAVRCVSAAVAMTVAVMAPAAHAADPFAAAGAKATLSVEYVYESAGKQSSEGMYDPYEWRVKRSASLVADLAAQPATAMPTLQAIDAGQMAELKDKGAKARSVEKKMEPMMADVQKIIEKCGEDEACITRETQKMGEALRGTKELDTAMSAKKDMQDLSKQGAPRYQAWRPTMQKGTYFIDETVHISSTDPICTGKPRHRCTRDEVRKGSGQIPVPPDAKKNPGAVAGGSAVEVDTARNTITVTLPVPLFPLPYTETITTDEPEGTHDTPTPRGPQQKLLGFRVSATGGGMHDKPFTVALKGGWRSQAGEEVVALKGEFGDAGKLTVRWRFIVQ